MTAVAPTITKSAERAKRMNKCILKSSVVLECSTVRTTSKLQKCQVRQKQGCVSWRTVTECLDSTTETLNFFWVQISSQLTILCLVTGDNAPLNLIRFDLQVSTGAGQENRLSWGSGDDLIFRFRYYTTLSSIFCSCSSENLRL
ncbi:hypothetical protein AALO_G00224070 [Alosa alosa]|uniref:Uncharacterized protein n=1 Tax=Alosa alosa TaxID=278164 RepID=A0AAV6FXQ8_9TELE|nr:hypothetical protein AALO_G00224070 [Alosa alosa]